MKGFIRRPASVFAALGEKSAIRRLVYVIFLAVLALGECIFFGKVRRTFVFPALRGSRALVEIRMLAKTESRELGIRRYVEEAVLGPASLDLSPLLTKETTVRSCLFREGVVYADFSPSAALPPLAETGDLYHNLVHLKEGIKRNFPFVKEVRFFIAGNEAFPDKFGAFGPEL